MRGEWLNAVTKTLKAVRRGMQLSCRFSDPANDDFAFTITEPSDPAGKPLANLFSISLRGNGVNVLPSNVPGQPGNDTAAALLAGVSN